MPALGFDVSLAVDDIFDCRFSSRPCHSIRHTEVDEDGDRITMDGPIVRRIRHADGSYEWFDDQGRYHSPTPGKPAVRYVDGTEEFFDHGIMRMQSYAVGSVEKYGDAW